jgi:ubiquinone/menaquinone biosynthesis C-methylase UbiE
MPTCNACGGHDRDDLFTVNGFTLGRCTTCNLHYVDPMPDHDERMADQAAGEYGDGKQVLDADKQLASERTRTAQFQRYLDLVDKWTKPGKLLDVGCGAGHLLTLADQAGYHPEGIELTTERVVVAGRTGATIHVQPVEELSLPADRYAAITMLDVFSHLADPKATFVELGRLLQSGGVLVVATGEIDGHVRIGHLPEWTLGEELFFLGAGTINRFADAAALEVVDTQRTWLPEAIYTRERFRIRGRSRARNAVKTAMLAPGLLPAARWVMKRRHADNPIHSAVYVLRKP